MRLSKFSFITLAATIIFIWHGTAWSGEIGLIIKNGATLSLNDETLYLNCFDVQIEDGGILDLGSGLIEDSGRIYRDSGGNLIRGDGAIKYCATFLSPILLLLLE